MTHGCLEGYNSYTIDPNTLYFYPLAGIYICMCVRTCVRACVCGGEERLFFIYSIYYSFCCTYRNIFFLLLKLMLGLQCESQTCLESQES